MVSFTLYRVRSLQLNEAFMASVQVLRCCNVLLLEQYHHYDVSDRFSEGPSRVSALQKFKRWYRPNRVTRKYEHLKSSMEGADL